ncbi:hypothetical protein F5Y16DRAFT_381553 [Xylariaceae sp. FL0255]|nr:hypothetical protein F5Y16DRAFT_381553 [Xylariaceae sp. FL0255]
MYGNEIGSKIGDEIIPEGFPQHLPSDLAWHGDDLQESDYVHYFSDVEKLEVDLALRSFLRQEIDGDLVDCTNFPLPQLGPRLRELSLGLYNASGFFLLRGTDQDNYSVEEMTVIFLGIQSYVAVKRGRQDELGNMLVHITPASSKGAFPAHPRHSKTALPFHTDWGDILAFHTRSTDVKSGECMVASAYTIYNVLAKTRPDIIRTLARDDWPFIVPHPHFRPILFYQDSRLIINFQPDSLFESQRYRRPLDFPSLSSEQIEALREVQVIAERCCHRFSTQSGDIHFINNLVIMHGRGDIGDLGSGKRHLARLWLRNDDLSWEIPVHLRDLWDTIFEGDEQRVWNIEPMPGAAFSIRKYAN